MGRVDQASFSDNAGQARKRQQWQSLVLASTVHLLAGNRIEGLADGGTWAVI